MTIYQQLNSRSLVHNTTPNTDELLNNQQISFYVGFDPSANSLHIGHLVPIIVMKHLQNAGHRPIALVGGATGMVGDPSGKDKERNLLTKETLRYNQEQLKKQLSQYLDFDKSISNSAILVNNYDWFREMSFLEFIRDFGKFTTINYMMAKESVKKRIESEQGISYTEFSYQLIQAYDFLYLFEQYGCMMQIGGSDQWGNITTGTELIRKKCNEIAYAFTTPLLVKSDGGKFGKSEGKNVWLDPKKTSPFEFYQFWINSSDEDSRKWIKIFTFLSLNKIEDIINQHDNKPENRLLQKTLASEITSYIHGKEETENVIEATHILFYNSDPVSLYSIKEIVFEQIVQTLQVFDIPKENENISITETLVYTKIFKSKGEARKMIENGGIYLNKEKILNTDYTIFKTQKLFQQYILLQKGKKNYFILRFTS